MIIIKSELIALKTSIFNQLSVDSEDAKILLGTTGNFITTLSNKQNFDGDYKEKILYNLKSYEEAITQRRELSNELSNKIASSLDTIINAMGNKDKIDTSKKASLQEEVLRCRNILFNLEKKLRAATKENIYQIENDIFNYEEHLIFIEDELAKIERVEEADAKALSNLNGLEDMISAYQTKTAEIESEKSHIPAHNETGTGVYLAAQN